MSLHSIPANSLSENIELEDTLNVVKIAIRTKKRWIFFLLELFQWLFIGLVGMPVIGLLGGAALQEYLPEILDYVAWILIGGIWIYILYKKFLEVLEYIFDREVIEIDNLSIRVEKSGLGFKVQKEYLAENIRNVSTLIRIPFINTKNVGGFMIWMSTGLNRYRFIGRGMPADDAQLILDRVYIRFPQYKV